MMKKIIIHITILILIFGFTKSTNAQTLKNTGTGRIHNNGKGVIKVKGAVRSEEANTRIENKGKMIIEGNALIKQDTLAGRVEFTGKKSLLPSQTIPQIYFENVFFSGDAEKKFDPRYGSQFVSINNISTTNEAYLRLDKNYSIFVEGKMTHEGSVNYFQTHGRVILKGEKASQDVDGAGIFRELELNNNLGSDLINKSDFKVTRVLELRTGELRNEKDSNFTMMDGSEIVRHVGATLKNEPKLEDKISVRYEGNGSLTSGAEIPKNKLAITNLIVKNTDTLFVDRNIQVNDSMYVGANIVVDKDTLTLASAKNPVFKNDENIEISGSFRRTVLQVGDTILLNNPYTFALFKSDADKGDASEITSYVRPYTFQLNGTKKVKRTLNITIADNNRKILNNGFIMGLRYGWRHNPAEKFHETNGLTVAKLALQKWQNNNWVSLKSEVPDVLSTKSWAYGYSGVLTGSGLFVIGSDDLPLIVFRAKVMLEGSYKRSQDEKQFGLMAHDLWSSKLIPTKPDVNQYPHNLNPSFDFSGVTAIPDSVVDWVVVEFRKNKITASDRFFKTCFVRYDGTLVATDGTSPIIFDNNDQVNTDSDEYFVFIRHRNHLPIKTNKSVALTPANNDVIYDYTDPGMIEGAPGSMKLVDIDNKGNQLFAMRAGYFLQTSAEYDDFRATIEKDYIGAYNQFTNMGYLLYDYDMDGIITTKDYNISWNNRMK